MRPGTEHPSPNHNARVGVDDPSLVVLHFTGMASTGAALERLCNPVSELSCHYLIDRGGEVFRLVPEDRRAWHAGAGMWGGVGDVNSRSIGIELDNNGREPFAEPLMVALEEVLADILARTTIRPEGVIGHQDMAPGRKDDPGRLFDWRRLAAAGLSVWPEAGDAGDFWDDCATFGYPGREDVSDSALLAAFRARFRPDDSSAPENLAPDRTDRALARDLARRFPFDRTRLAP